MPIAAAEAHRPDLLIRVGGKLEMPGTNAGFIARNLGFYRKQKDKLICNSLKEIENKRWDWYKIWKQLLTRFFSSFAGGDHVWMDFSLHYRIKRFLIYQSVAQRLY